jgi:cyclic-di-GMP-binding protein
MEDHTTIKLQLPSQDFTGEPLFRPTLEDAKDWVQNLPVTNTNLLVQLMHQALGELNQTKLAPEKRFAVMEILLPNLLIGLLNLSKRYMNQPLIMPEEPRRMADLSDQLLSQAATCYTIVAIETIQQRDEIRTTNPARLTCEAIQRALVFMGRRVLQHFLLHSPMEVSGWQTLHQLYVLANNQRLVDLPVPNPLTGGNTIKTTYLQTVMIGCCKVNQLRQSELTALYRGFQQWSERVIFSSEGTGKDLFMVDLDSDQAPLYTALYRKTPGPMCRFIDATALVEHLIELKQEAGGKEINFDKTSHVPVSLLEHLITCLGSMSLRNFKRTATEDVLRICVGLNSTHFHVAGERLFEQLIQRSAEGAPESEVSADNVFLNPHSQADVWQAANPGDYTGEQKLVPNLLIDVDSLTHSRFMEIDSAQSVKERYPTYKAKLADASPGGYCVEWTSDLPGDIKAGDIVGLKEEEHKDWVIAAIRWISRLSNAKTLIGLELLSPRAIAFGASIHRKGEGRAAPMRVLLLPEIKLVAQPQTLITPRTGFKERQKITLASGAETSLIQLLRHVASTGSYSQFEFCRIKELGDVLASNALGSAGGEFDSVWSHI